MGIQEKKRRLRMGFDSTKDYWQKYNKKGTLRTVLSTNFEDILKLGSYRYRYVQLFRGTSYYKYRLSSFRLRIHFYDGNRHCGRMWGMYKDDNMNFSNLYA
jgi:hypothetical protein